MSTPTVHEALLFERYTLEWSLSKACSHPAVSPHLALSPRGMVLFLAKLKAVCEAGVISAGIAKVALALVLETTFPLNPFTVIKAPSPISDPVIVNKPPLNDV